jgi:chloride channel protein, CIC family
VTIGRRRDWRARVRLHTRILVATFVGLLTGLVVAGMHAAIFATWEPLSHRADPWIAALPILGLLASAGILRLGRQRSGDTTEEYVRIFHTRAERIDLRGVPYRLAAAIATIGLGGSLGLEGPSIYAGAAIGDWAERRFGRVLSEAETERTILIAGAAAGISAIFKAPVTGIVFALEVPYRDDLARRALVPAIFAAAASYLVFVALIGTTPLFPVAAVPLSLGDLLASLLIGIACGLAARALIALVHGAARVREHVGPWASAVAAGLGLVVLGSIALAVFDRPLVLGPGYIGIALASRGELGAGLLIALLAMKLVATSTTTAGGGVGGLFFPAVMMGAAAGGALGHVVPGPASLFAVVGMAAFLGGAYKVPLAGVAFVAEATGAPGYIIPGLLAAALGYLLSGPGSLSAHQRARE